MVNDTQLNTFQQKIKSNPNTFKNTEFDVIECCVCFIEGETYILGLLIGKLGPTFQVGLLVFGIKGKKS